MRAATVTLWKTPVNNLSLFQNREHRPHVSSVWRYHDTTMSLKVSIEHGTRGVTVEKDRKREKKVRS